MSAKHPVIAVTGSSGAGTTTTSLAFRKIFAQLNLHAAEVEGDSFHRYTRPEMDMASATASRDLAESQVAGFEGVMQAKPSDTAFAPHPTSFA